MKLEGSDLLPEDSKDIFESAGDQLKILSEFFRCRIVHDFFEALQQDDNGFELILFSKSPSQELMLERESYIGEAKARKQIRLALLEMREILLNQLNHEEQEQ